MECRLVFGTIIHQLSLLNYRNFLVLTVRKPLKSSFLTGEKSVRVTAPCLCFSLGDSMWSLISSVVHRSLQAFLPMSCGVEPPTSARSFPVPGPVVMGSNGLSLSGKFLAFGSRTPSFETSAV